MGETSDTSARYPAFVYLHEDRADPRFVAAVKTAIASIDFDNSSLHPTVLEILRDLKTEGWDQVLEPIQRLAAQGDNSATVVMTNVLCAIGDLVFRRIPEERLLAYIPKNNVEIVPVGAKTLVQFRSLRSRATPHGTVYYSRHLPKLNVNGEAKTVAFTKHAMEQTCARIGMGWQTYAGFGDVFALFDRCLHYERVVLYPDQLAFTYYDVCPANFWREHFAEQILGEDQVLSGHKYYWRVGYCPAELHEEFVVAKTLLFPGYATTPEYGLIMNSRLGREEKQRMASRMKDMTAQRLIDDENLALMKWFHENGVPQVVQLEGEPYAQEL